MHMLWKCWEMFQSRSIKCQSCRLDSLFIYRLGKYDGGEFRNLLWVSCVCSAQNKKTNHPNPPTGSVHWERWVLAVQISLEGVLNRSRRRKVGRGGKERKKKRRRRRRNRTVIFMCTGISCLSPVVGCSCKTVFLVAGSFEHRGYSKRSRQHLEDLVSLSTSLQFVMV